MINNMGTKAETRDDKGNGTGPGNRDAGEKDTGRVGKNSLRGSLQIGEGRDGPEP